MKKNVNIDVIREIGIDKKDLSLSFVYSLLDDCDEIEIGNFMIDSEGHLSGELNLEMLLYNKELISKAKDVMYENGLKQILNLDNSKNLFDNMDSINIDYLNSEDVSRWDRANQYIKDNNIKEEILDDYEIYVSFVSEKSCDPGKQKIKE